MSVSSSGHTCQQDVPLLSLSEKSGIENSAVSGSGLWEPQPGGDFLRRKLWGLKHTRAHAPGGSEQLWMAGNWGQRLQVEGQEGQKGPRGGRKGPGLQSPQPSQTSPRLSPCLVIFKALGKAEAVRLQGKSGKNESKFQKGELSVLQYHEWNSCHLPAQICLHEETEVPWLRGDL